MFWALKIREGDNFEGISWAWEGHVFFFQNSLQKLTSLVTSQTGNDACISNPNQPLSLPLPCETCLELPIMS